MEVIHVILGKANPNRMNGVNRVVNELATRQAAAGISVQVWGVAGDTEHNYPGRNYVTRLFKRARLPFAIGVDLQAALLSQVPGTVFHLHGGFIPLMYRISVLLHKYHLPYVITPHGSYNKLAMRKSWLAKYVYASLFERWLLRRAKFVHVLGDSEVLASGAWCTPDRILKIPYGIDRARVGAAVSDHPHNRFVIGYCGRIDMHTKGLDTLVDGFQTFHKRHADSQLWIIGDGGDMVALKERISAAGLSNDVILWGACYGAEKDMYLAACDVFAHPSRNEGLPSAVLEAAAMGVPCLVTKATNTAREVAAYNCGVAIDDSDSKQVADGLSSLHYTLRSGSRHIISANALRMVHEMYNWDQLIGEYRFMYERALTA